MENWQWGLALLVVAWALQAAGTWKQMRHYRAVMGDITRRWPDGWLGVGNARGGLRKGVIAIVVATRDDTVRRVLVMEGRSVFAKFVAVEGVEGTPLDRLSSADVIARSAGRKTAVAMAVEQIGKARAKANAAADDADGAAIRPKTPDEDRPTPRPSLALSGA